MSLSAVAFNEAQVSGARSAGRLTIDLSAVAENYRRLKTLTGGQANVAAVVKANAYGLGAIEVARRLGAEGCRVFFVAHPGEGAALLAARALPAGSRVYLLNGLCGEDPGAVADLGLVPVLNSLGEMQIWRRTARLAERRLPAIVQLDTGMNRTGLPADEARRLLADPAGETAGLEIEAFMSHLACADDPASPMNAGQRERFLGLTRHLPQAPLSLANSAGILLGTDYHFDLVRPGIALYGLNPQASGENPMLPSVTLEARVLQCRVIDTGESVGYGATFIAGGAMRLATIGVGYADGYPRALSNRGMALFGVHAAPIVGRVSMDLVTLDVTNVPESVAHPGAYCTLIGPGLPAESVGSAAGSVGYEVLTNLGARYPRIYLDSR